MHNWLGIQNIRNTHIYSDWSGSLIFLLVMWPLTGSVLVYLQAQWGLALDWGMALVASILILISLFVHELAHALAAAEEGMPAYRLLLNPFGDSTHTSADPASPEADLLIALAGPLTSLILGMSVLLLGDVHLPNLDQVAINPVGVLVELGPVSTLLLGLGFANVLLGALNLIPALPLDGGNILRSILWAAWGDRRRARQWASRLGQLIAWGLVISGILIAITASTDLSGLGLAGGLAVVFSGLVLYRAGKQNCLQLTIEDALKSMPVASYMGVGVLSVPANIPVSSLVRDFIIGSDERACPVIDRGRLVGLVHLGDVRNVPFEKWDLTEVGEIMTGINQLVEAKSTA